MITKLYLENFRSVVRDEVELGKITVLTGPNNTGKSSIIYALLALKNIVLNSNQSLDGCLTLGFISLGGFSQMVYLKDETLNMGLGIDVEGSGLAAQYLATLGKTKSTLHLSVSKPIEASLNLDIAFPYAANNSTGCEVTGDLGTVKISWNGITSTISIENGQSSSDKEFAITSKNISDALSAPIEELRKVDFVPLRRGFVKAIYSSVPMQQQLLTEDELATLLGADRDLEGKVGHYLEKIVDRVFNVRPTVGTANFNLQTRDRKTGLVFDLVNEGFGTNQLVTILTKVLRKDIQTICIEESEIHLHPEAMGKLVDVFVEITREEGKNFIISTHSEHIVLSLLSKVAKKSLDVNDLRIYYLSKDGKRTNIQKQEINEKGQIKGGLKGFYEAELKTVKEFFDVAGE